MAYFLDFDERALKEWRKLGSTVREQLKKKLVEVLESPRIEANKLRGMPDCYKIKLRSSGYRLVYQVIDEKVVVFVISVVFSHALFLPNRWMLKPVAAGESRRRCNELATGSSRTPLTLP